MDLTKRCLLILEALAQEYPEAGTRLKFSSVFELLVAVVLSAQSTDEQVNRVTAQLFKRFNTPQDLAEIELPLLEDLIKGVGLYKNKALNIKKLATIIRDKYNSSVPGDFKQLLELPGVGRKTANVIMSVGFDQPGLGVDTHVMRVANRLGLVDSIKPIEVELALKELIPMNMWGKAHHLLIFHGRKVCKARKPICSDCVIKDYCQYYLLISK
ncbi:MAG: endonuclease III [Syntrophomonadaceae bacterium]|jgi:endonuclease-3